MADSLSEVQLRAQVRLACGRIAGSMAAIVEAHSLGVPEGRHQSPWASGYHRDAVHVYAKSLPYSYQCDIAALFKRCAETMANCSIPAPLATDWNMVSDYTRSASAAIKEHQASRESESRQPAADTARIGERHSPPMVIRFDLLARLTTSDGASRLEQATVAVRQHMDALVPEVLEDLERYLLKRLVAGAPIVDLAAEMGYSERSTYRVLAALWEKLGASGRQEGLLKATSEGLLD